ncbi:carboxypeptidase-like regulatory domain-containing protein [Seonamhaeicola sp. ML3]|uniref:TonB-dependent receptor n=1 Tax=Seonamhaeicola sp. ML3 TaxID=2937786 RepID=UPI00200E0514|nr:carboxypeptidase-like regulatory domain-containing protein [Seonamhaeicola sp. ML3]
MNLTKLFSFLILFFAITSQLQAQEKKLLANLISELETEFDVKFSYSVNDVEGVAVTIPKEVKSLNQIVDYLNEVTLLNFKFLNERYITVSTLNKTITVCGVLVSGFDDSPLFGASVVVKHSSKGVITDDNGVFTLTDIRVNDIISLSYLGYESLEIKAKDLLKTDNSCKTLVLIEKEEALNKVVVYKFLTTGLQKQTDGSTVLNTSKFGILPGLTEPDVLQSIQALPGVESVNESIANINVRGGTNDQNLVLWDGIKMYHSGHFFGLISAYNPYLTNKVIVAKNGTSSEFSDGVSSTIDMRTKNELTSRFTGGFGANLIHADAFLEIPISKKLAFHFSGRRSFADYLSSPTYDNYFERSFQDSELSTNRDNISESNRSSDFFFYDYSAKVLYDFNENHKFRATIIGVNNNLDYTEAFTNNNGEKESKTSNLKQENLGFGGSWNAIWNNKFSTDFNVFYSKYNVFSLDNRIETNQEFSQANEVLETGLKFKTNFRLSNFINLLNGYQFSEIGVLNATEVSAPAYDKTKKDVLLNHAVFNELEFNNKNTYLRFGVRWNYFQKFNKLIIEPRLNFRQRLLNGLAFKLQGEFKNQSATQIIDFQDDFLGVEKRRWILANERSIPISESKQVSSGFELKKNNWLLDIEGFYKHVDGITTSNQGFYNNFQSINAIGSYTARGAEVLVNKTSKNLSAWLSYTYSLNDYEFKTLTPSTFPNNVDIRHSISLAFNYEIVKSFKVSVGGIWRTGRPYTKPVEGNETVQSGNNTFVNYDTPNSENLDDFMRLDTSLNYSFNISNGIYSSLRLGVINFLNKRNSINRYYEVSPNDSNTTIEIENRSLGLTPNLSWRCRF